MLSDLIIRKEWAQLVATAMALPLGRWVCEQAILMDARDWLLELAVVVLEGAVAF